MNSYQNSKSINWKKRLQGLPKEDVLLVIVLAVCAPLCFVNAFKYSVPMGYAGMFTQMAQQIASANFRLPLQSPYYGPGGIPFAYPPLGLYLLAVLIKLTGKYFIFLRLVPPLLSLISLIPLFYLTRELTKSAIAAAFTAVIAATSLDLYIAHAWASGIVRAPAFIFALLSIYFFMRHRDQPSRKNIFWTGVFFGLTILTHLEYALFCFAWIVCWTIFSRDFVKRAMDSLISIAIGALISLIWILPVLFRYGMSVVLNAFRTHGNGSFISRAFNPAGLIKLLWINLSPISSDKIVALLVLVGVLALIVKKDYILLVFYFFIILAFPDGSRFVFLVGSLIAGLGLSFLVEQLPRLFPERIKFLSRTASIIVSLPILAFIWVSGFSALANFSPVLDDTTLDLAQNIQRDLPVGKSYLALMNQDEAEWMPFLFQREPVVSQWGSEWLGTYDQQTSQMSLFHDCQKAQDWSCVVEVIHQTEKNPDAVITHAIDKKLNSQILSTKQWVQVFANKRYIVWEPNR